jgi:uncharacterized OB-fold protein
MNITTQHQHDAQKETFAFSGGGEVYSFTVLQDAPQSFAEQAPYILALIKLDEGPIITAQLTDVDGPLNIGDRVEMVTRKLSTEGPQGIIIYGYKFRPVISRNNQSI